MTVLPWGSRGSGCGHLSPSLLCFEGRVWLAVFGTTPAVQTASAPCPAALQGFTLTWGPSSPRVSVGCQYEDLTQCSGAGKQGNVSVRPASWGLCPETAKYIFFLVCDFTTPAARYHLVLCVQTQ